MTGNMEQPIDLTAAFRAASQVLIENKAALNEADTLNHDHGDNMVRAFQTIAGAMQKKSGAAADQQLAYAAQALRSKAKDASSQIYADGLQNAAEQFKGQTLTRGGALDLISALMGINTGGQQQAQQSQGGGMGDLLGSLLGGTQQQAPAQSQGADMGDLLGSLLGGTQQQAPAQGQGADMGDLLGSLLGGTQQQAPAQSQGADMGDLLGSLLGGTQQQAPAQSQGGGMGDLLGSLLGGTQQQAPAQSQGGGMGDLLGSLLGGAQQQPQQTAQQSQKPGLDLLTLLQYGLGYIQATQAGATPLQALVQVLMNSGSRMGSRDYRAQSGALVMQALAQAMGAAQ